jgi:hypothetical protein
MISCIPSSLAWGGWYTHLTPPRAPGPTGSTPRSHSFAASWCIFPLLRRRMQLGLLHGACYHLLASQPSNRHTPTQPQPPVWVQLADTIQKRTTTCSGSGRVWATLIWQPVAVHRLCAPTTNARERMLRLRYPRPGHVRPARTYASSRHLLHACELSHHVLMMRLERATSNLQKLGVAP